jgi:flavin-dependent dehydrogenase
MELTDGSRVAVIGGGPAGSFTSYFLLEMADRVDLDLAVHIYEPQDFQRPGPAGCNHCGGIISESLVQMLAAEGINLPSSVVQRGIEAYVMHTDDAAIRIATPVAEQRIGALHRGSGPKGSTEKRWESFDGHLLQLACERGALHLQQRVENVRWEDGFPHVKVKGGEEERYDLVILAVGVNSSGLKVLDDMGVQFQKPKLTKAFISEIHLGPDGVREKFGNAMHVFLLGIPRLEFAALIPKGAYVTACMLGEDIDKELAEQFFAHPQVRGCLPDEWTSEQLVCKCIPKMNIGAATPHYGDRFALVGDCGVSRLYKDGIGAAYRTAKACAVAAVVQGVSEEQFRRFYEPACRRLERDNRIGKAIFTGAELFRKLAILRRAMFSLVQAEQNGKRPHPAMSSMVWDLFTGSAPYADIVRRGMNPRFMAAFAQHGLGALVRKERVVQHPDPAG